MTDLLRPPPEHDLPPDRAGDIRRAVMRSASGSRRHQSRRYAGLLVPVLVVLAIVAAMIGLRPAQAPSVLGSPSPTPATTSSSDPPDGAVNTDAGALSETEAVAAIKKLHRGFGPSADAEVADVLFARRTTTSLGDGTLVVWADTSGSTWWDVEVPGVMGSWFPVAGPAIKKARRVPDAAQPVIRLTDLESFGWRMDADRPDATARDLHIQSFYRVSSAVDRVEVRMTVEGKPGPWFTAPVFDGYTCVTAVVPGAHSTTEDVDKVTKIEDRAFDHDGNLVPIARG